MTNNPQTPSPASPTRKGAARPPLYRTVLSIAVASIVAAWLPFSVLYISALSKHAHVAASPRLVPQNATATGAQPAAQLTPVTTRTS